VQVMQEGQTIKHEVYGLGIVTASDQERTAVDFDDHGAKLFVTSIMTAELIGESTGHAAEDQAAAQSVDRSQGRQESCRRGRSKPVVSPSQVPQFLDPCARRCRGVSACFSRSEIKDCGRFTRMKRSSSFLGSSFWSWV